MHTPFMDLLSRRRVLMGIGAGLLGLGVAGVVKSITPGAPESGFLVLDAEGIRLTRLLTERFVGSLHDRVDVAKELDATLHALPEIGALWVRLPLLLEQSSRLNGGAFSSLSAPEQEAILQEWANSPLALRRQIYHGLRDLIVSHFYMHPASWADIHYEGPWVGRLDLPVHPLRFPVEVSG